LVAERDFSLGEVTFTVRINLKNLQTDDFSVSCMDRSSRKRPPLSSIENIVSKDNGQKRQKVEVVINKRAAPSPTESNRRKLPPVAFMLNPVTHKTSYPFLIEDGNDYAWSDGRHKCMHGSLDQLPSFEHIDSSCSVLAYLGRLFYSPIFKAIISPSHHCVIPFSELGAYLERHQKSPIRRSRFILKRLLEHVKAAFDLSPSQSSTHIMNTIEGVELRSQIPGLHDPVMAIRCNVCLGWYNALDGGTKNIKAHARACSGEIDCTILNSLPCQWTCTLFRGGVQNFASRIPFVKGWTPPVVLPAPAPLYESPSTLRYDTPQYLKDLGWNDYIIGLNADHPKLIQLIALPSKSTINSWPEDSPGWRFEHGLSVLHDVIRDYLVDANSKVATSHNSIRIAVTDQ
jgi:hypothetical protein